MTTTVCSVRDLDPAMPIPANVVYVGRKMFRDERPDVRKGSPFGNPFKGDNFDPLAYLEHIKSKPDILNQLPLLRGKRLACWCGTWDGVSLADVISCHASILAYILNTYTDEQIRSGDIRID